MPTIGDATDDHDHTVTIVTKNCRGCGRPDELDAGDVDLDNELVKSTLRWWRKSLCADCIEDAERIAKAGRLRASHDKRLARAHFPLPFHALLFDEMDRSAGREEVILAAEGWANGNVKRLFIQSRPGTGKTRLAATATAAALWHRQVYWANVPSLFRAAGADFKSRERKDAEAVLFSHAAIVLDDLGNENPTDAARQALQTALQTRLDHDARIFITSNLTVPQIAARYTDPKGRGGDWLASRLATFDQYVMPGVDRRLEMDL